MVPASELINTAEQLASDIVSTEPVTRNTVREIIDSGWHASLAEGLKIEHDANREHAKTQVSAEKVAARRATDTATRTHSERLSKAARQTMAGTQQAGFRLSDEVHRNGCDVSG